MTLAYAEAVYRLAAPEITPTECAVLAQLALMADDEGKCWPKQATVAVRARLHVDTVKAALRTLNAKGLIRKDQRLRDDGSQTSSMIVMAFEPADLKSGKSGAAPPRGGSCAPSGAAGVGVVDPGAPGALRPPHESSIEGSVEPPVSPPGGQRGDAYAKQVVEELWKLTPKPSRERSSKADLLAKVKAALKRGGELDPMADALTRYFADPHQAREGGVYLKGVHRMIENDRWREWAPPDGDDAPSDRAPALAGAAPPPVKVSEAKAAEIVERAWRTRLADFKRIGRWDPAQWGGRPGEPFCKAPSGLLAEYGYAGTT